MKKDILIGGMALIEGVMMKSPTKIGLAVRTPKGTIHRESFNFISMTQKYKFLNIPFVRGVINMIEMMILGIKTLNRSADIALDEEGDGQSSWAIALSLMLGLVFAIFLFKFLPFGAAQLSTIFLGVTNQSAWFVIIEGIVKMCIFLGYLLIISLFPDIYRVFMYHGAEHKTVHCQELKKELTVKNVAACSRYHPRCGTSFVLFIILLSVVTYMFIPAGTGFVESFILRLLLLPIIAGVSYEILKISAKSDHSIIFKIISAPGLWTQRITTKEPDDKQIEIAIAALKASL